MKKRIFTIFGFGLIIGALFFGGYNVYSAIQSQVGLNGCETITTVLNCVWRKISVLASNDSGPTGNNGLFPIIVGQNEQAIYTASLSLGRDGDNARWVPIRTNIGDNSSTTGVMGVTLAMQDVAQGTLFAARNARELAGSGASNASFLGVGIGLLDGTSTLAALKNAKTEVDATAGLGILVNAPFGFNGTTWDKLRTASGDALANIGIASGGNVGFNGTTWDRLRTADATSLTATISQGIPLTAPLSTWVETDAPASATQATASHAAGAAGVRHVITSITACLHNGGGIFDGRQLNLRDGASGAGTIVWAQLLGITAVAGSTQCETISGLAITGSTATAITLEFASAPSANNFETVSLTGYSVQ